MTARGTERFEFRFEEAYRRPARLFGITPATAWLELDGESLRARFGRWHLQTPLANITAVAATGPYAFLKTAGPARLGVTDRGLTFATNGKRGVLMTFQNPVPCIDPLGLVRHPELTATVADIEGLIERLRAAGASG